MERKRVAKRAVVVRTERLTRQMVRVVFAGDDLRGWGELPFTDHYIKILFPPAGAGYRWPFDADEIRRSHPGDVDAFVHGNADMVRDVRRYLFIDRGLERARVSISGYWRTGHTEDRWQSTKRDFAAQLDSEEQIALAAR